eukprot:TRINITY_DN54060_c0_g1_i1.p1 TRINITY_DN54060_c0_g1~~TRINITY_DN54060_c0_g1_i1.p1  ORF type:complete len:144 (-),score=21.70 TRINITY_DN54060_c0_g1_i1:133-564(-)
MVDFPPIVLHVNSTLCLLYVVGVATLVHRSDKAQICIPDWETLEAFYVALGFLNVALGCIFWVGKRTENTQLITLIVGVVWSFGFSCFAALMLLAGAELGCAEENCKQFTGICVACFVLNYFGLYVVRKSRNAPDLYQPMLDA